jgi:lauroyl/myristoyl acyltransferase
MCLTPYKSLSEIKSILKKNFQNFGMSLMEIFIIPRINKEYIQRNIEIQGLEYLIETLKQKKGAILL